MLTGLKNDGDAAPAKIPLFGFITFWGMIGFEDEWAFDRKWELAT